MIIQCKNCSKKFLVKDSDIPNEGRMVECGYCSQKWFQTSTKIQSSIESDIDENTSKKKIEEVEIENISKIMELEASDGRTYTFLGSQWAELLRSGKTGALAKRKIAAELNKLSGLAAAVKPKSRKRMIDPSSEQIGSKTIKEKQLPDVYRPKKGLGFFGYIFLLIIITLSIVGILKTFQNELIMYFPETEYIFDKGENIFESMGYIIIIIKDLIKSY